MRNVIVVVANVECNLRSSLLQLYRIDEIVISRALKIDNLANFLLTLENFPIQTID